jgi:hypothetical protein
MFKKKCKRASKFYNGIGLAVALVSVFQQYALSETPPCRGFSGGDYSRERLLSLCGEPDEILERETQRIILWRYKGYPYTIVESDRSTGERGRVNSVSGIRSGLIPKNRLTPTKSAATPEKNTLFLSILDEAAAVSEK